MSLSSYYLDAPSSGNGRSVLSDRMLWDSQVHNVQDTFRWNFAVLHTTLSSHSETSRKRFDRESDGMTYTRRKMRRRQTCLQKIDWKHRGYPPDKNNVDRGRWIRTTVVASDRGRRYHTNAYICGQCFFFLFERLNYYIFHWIV